MSYTNIIIGLQYGDEGKGKIVDYLAKDYDCVVRYSGGNNAGHTIYRGNKKYVLRHIPSAIFLDKICVIGIGCVVNLKVLIDEIEYLKSNNIDVSRLLISDRAHVSLDWHVLYDVYLEKKVVNSIGTTKNGIGPTYADKHYRFNLRVGELKHKDVVMERLLEFSSKYSYLKEMDLEKLYLELYKYYQYIEKYVVNCSYYLNEMLDNNKKILLEGAQGVLLDIDHGMYPYVTSSGVCTDFLSGTGLGISKFKDLYGVFKVYMSKVGNGPLPTEIDDNVANYIRDTANEYGSVTGRPRRIGWLDLVVLKYSIMITKPSYLIATLLDILSGVEEIKLCVKYIYKGKEVDCIPSTVKEYSEYKPLYITIKGWKEDISKSKSINDLPANCIYFLKFIEDYLGVAIKYVSIGPKREQIISYD